MTITAQRIYQRRVEREMTQDELAKAAGYTSRSSIAKIEKGEVDLPQSKIVAIADALDTTPAYLMGWDIELAKTDTPEGLDERLKMFTSLPPEAQERVLEYMRFEVQKQSQ